MVFRQMWKSENSRKKLIQNPTPQVIAEYISNISNFNARIRVTSVKDQGCISHTIVMLCVRIVRATTTQNYAKIRLNTSLGILNTIHITVGRSGAWLP